MTHALGWTPPHSRLLHTRAAPAPFREGPRWPSNVRSLGYTRSISWRHIEPALRSQTAANTIGPETTDPKIRYVGLDDRGAEKKMVAVVLPGPLLIVHAMPTRYRRGAR